MTKKEKIKQRIKNRVNKLIEIWIIKFVCVANLNLFYSS